MWGRGRGRGEVASASELPTPAGHAGSPLCGLTLPAQQWTVCF